MKVVNERRQGELSYRILIGMKRVLTLNFELEDFNLDLDAEQEIISWSDIEQRGYNLLLL